MAIPIIIGLLIVGELAGITIAAYGVYTLGTQIIDHYTDGSSALKRSYQEKKPDGEIVQFPTPNIPPLLDVIPVPDSKKDLPSGDVFFGVLLLYPGAAVIALDRFGYEEAKNRLLHGEHVWTTLEAYALALAIYVSGGFVGPENHNGKDAIHYHLKKRQGDVHIFFGEDPLLQHWGY